MRLIRIAGVCLLAAVAVAGCLPRRPGFPAYGTMEAALGEVLHEQFTIAYQEPFGKDRVMVLFRTDKHPALSPTVLERTDFGKWRMTGAVGLGGARPRGEALSYNRASLGRVEEKIGTTTFITAQAHYVFGEVLDPAITWVELTLYEEGARPIRATVKDGIWVVKLPAEKQHVWFDLKAGDEGGLRFARGFGRRVPESMVEYLDVQQGIRLQHPAAASPWIDGEGRLNIAFNYVTITLERQRSPQAESNGQILEQDTRPLGTRQATYTLEASPEKDGKGSAYTARYLVPVGDARWEVTCSASHIYETDIWREYLVPGCDRVLTTVQFEEK